MEKGLDRVVGFHRISKDEARNLLMPYVSHDGYYLLRPAADTKGGAFCTIQVTNQGKLLNYRLIKDKYGFYVIQGHTETFRTISELIAYYNKVAINSQVNSLMLTPVVAHHGEPDGQYVDFSPPNTVDSTPTVNNSGSRSPHSPTREEDISSLPGYHIDLPKNQVSAVMQPHLNKEGSYILRPSVSSKGQITISVSCQGSVLNFKINVDPKDHKYFITPKRKFHTVGELVACHTTFPLRSKQRAGAKIYLLHPIAPILPLPPPWEEFFDSHYNRSYYFNPQTQVTTWERPKPDTSHRQSLTIPSIARTSSPTNQRNFHGPRSKSASLSTESSLKISTSSNMRSRTPGTSKRGPLPEIPTKNPAPKRELPALPAKEETAPPPSFPRLPAKESSSPSTFSRPFSQQPNTFSESKVVPPLPPKVPETQSLPRLPPKETTLPQLPPKVTGRQPPALPEKEPPLENNRPTVGKPKLYEYEELMTETPPRLPGKEQSVSNGPSGKGPPVPPGGVPPPPPVGAPVPPPPPPSFSPASSPSTFRKPQSSPPTVSVDTGSGRPFSANDLAQMKTLLKKKDAQADLSPRKTEGGLQGIFEDAISSRLDSIRSAVGSDDDDTDIEDVDDDWDDDD